MSRSGLDSVGFLGFVPLFGHIVLAAIIRFFTFPFRTVRSTTLSNDVYNAAIRCAIHRITIAQSRYLYSGASESYLAHCKKANIAPQTVEVEGECGKIDAYWIGNPDAETVILYLHGGGYTIGPSTVYFDYMSRLLADLNDRKSRRSVGVLFVAYTLAPEGTHPTQLREAVIVLSYLVTKTGRSPSEILISGDSAGGNLAIALLSHILHPHPGVVALKLQRALAVALL
ncbi:alpha/beta-hydrolase [Decorospora gaudefroyi]|uniref:Alpha/beta-hydrolase n=1 Tax=Decorospora gaudefroyi TaxID=184978 RepID=A0A6A5KAE1_9PLEO|nr:alpha/beta-hydrolase [Decorospora gaudefroyi]